MDPIGKVLDFHGEALRLRAERQRVIASNVANADTPRFKARDFDFAQALAEATGAGATPGRPAATDARHLGAGGGPAAAATLAYRIPAQSALDGNSVEVDAERARFAENTVRYEASLRFLNGQIKSILAAIQGQ